MSNMLQLNYTDAHLPLSEYSFERRFDERGAIEWMQANWQVKLQSGLRYSSNGTWVHRFVLLTDSAQVWLFTGNPNPFKPERSKSFVFSALYATLVFGGQHYMKLRPKMNLRRPLVLWSLSLALFSIIGAVRTGSYMLHILSSGGFRQSICDQSFYIGPVSKFWAYAFVLSKAPELGDTVFIVLRKQKLLFLHWYHHITVLLYSWYSYKDMVAGGGWFMTMNYAVHALMYSYYAARAASLRVPRPFAVLITSAQITQMAMGLMVTGLVYLWLQQGDCPSRIDNITWAALMYLSYLLLFSNFFYQTYLRRRDAEAKTSKAE